MLVDLKLGIHIVVASFIKGFILVQVQGKQFFYVDVRVSICFIRI